MKFCPWSLLTEVLPNIFTNDLELTVLWRYPVLNKMDDNLQEDVRGGRIGEMQVNANEGQVKHMGKSQAYWALSCQERNL